MKKKIDNNCINEFDPTSLGIEDAIAKIRKSIKSINKHEYINLKNAIGRISSENIKSQINIPTFKNSAMDGYAVQVSDLSTKEKTILLEAGISYAGKPYRKKLENGQTVRVMTGAVIPDNADAVIMNEMVDISGTNIEFGNIFQKKQNIRFIGEDIKKSSIVIKKGQKIRYIDIGILASIGIKKIKVMRKPIISFFSTGDELISIGKKLKLGDIYDSNRYLLYGLLVDLPVIIKDMGVAKDNKKDIEKKFLQCSKVSDLIITTGGVSVGDADYIREILDKVGKIKFWKISVKPGRPLAFGKIKNAYFFGLPGNPVSTIVTFELFVQPAIQKLVSQNIHKKLYLRAITTHKMSKKKGRVEFKRGFLSQIKDKIFVTTKGLQGSNILSTLSEANCYIKLSSDTESVNKGDIVEVIPFAEVF